MTRVVLPLCFAALLGLTACGSAPNKMASTSSQPAASAASTAVTPYRAGNGVVQSVTPAPRIASAAGSTSAPVTTTRSEPVTAAGSAGSTAAAMQRLAIRMDDGRVQYVDMASGPDVPPVGSRVQLTPDYKIIRQP